MAIAGRLRHGRSNHGYLSPGAFIRLFFFLILCAISVSVFVVVAVQIFTSGSSPEPERHSRQLLADDNPNSQVIVQAAKVVWNGNKDAEKLRIGLMRPEVVSWTPRVVHLHNFLSPDECDALVAFGRPKLAKSTVVDSSTGKSISSQTRTSSGMFLTDAQRNTPLVKDIEERIATVTMTPLVNGEGIQILRYEPGEFYKPHPDFFSDQVNLKRGGQRVATVLMYLEAAEEGGETHFPQVISGTRCKCGGRDVTGLCVRPRKGDAVLFWSAKLNGEVDPESLHESCPVVKGEKWSATKWIRQGEFH